MNQRGMLRTVILMLFVLFTLALLLSTQVRCNYTNNLKPDQLELGIDNLVVIMTIGKIKGKEPAIIKGIAIPIGNDLILALTHTTKIPPFTYIQMPFDRIPVPREVLSEKWYIDHGAYGTPIELIGRKEDISLFRGKTRQKFPFLFGDSDKLRLGDKIVVLAFPYLKAFCVRSGVVANPDFKFGKNSIDMSPEVPVVLMDVLVNPGDSGSPVLAYRFSYLRRHWTAIEIVGIQCARFGTDGLGGSYPINYVQDCITEILNR